MRPFEDIPGRPGLPGPIGAADFNRNFFALATGRVCEVGAVSLYNEWERPYNRRAAPAQHENRDHAASRLSRIEPVTEATPSADAIPEENPGSLQANLDSRRAKLQRIRQRGIDPYPPRFRRGCTADEAVKLFEAD